VGPALRRAQWTNAVGAFGIADPARHEFERPDLAMGGNAGIAQVVELPLLHCALGEENPNNGANAAPRSALITSTVSYVGFPGSQIYQW
jgi:hypothetical protein